MSGESWGLIVMLVVMGIIMAVSIDGCSVCEDRGGAYVRNSYGWFTCVQKHP